MSYSPRATRGTHFHAAVSLLLATALVAGLFAVPALAADPPTATEPAGPWSIERLSLSPSGEEPDSDSYDPALSVDGTQVVFHTSASNLGTSPMPTSGGGNVVVRDLVTGAVEPVSIDVGGGRLAQPAEPAIDADGSTVVMSAGSSGSNRVVLHDRDAGTSTSLAAFAPARQPAVDDEGQRVALLEGDPNIDDGDVRQDLWLWDSGVASGLPTITEVIALSSPTERGDLPRISGDGTTVAVEVTAGRHTEVRVVDVSDLSDIPAAEVIDGGRLPSLSADGFRVAYAKRDAATNQDSVHVLDRLTGSDTVVFERPSSDYVSDVDLSADGRTVASVVNGFGGGDVWVSDVASGRTDAIAPVDSSMGRIDLGADGRTLVFSTVVNGVVPGDDNRMGDVFVARRTGASGPSWPAGARLTVDTISSSFASISWPAASDDLEVAAYLVQLDGATVAQVAPTATSHRITGLEPETTYEVSVVAVDADGNGSTALRADIFTEPRATEPGTATLSAIAGPGGVQLQWDPADGAVAHVVQRAVGDNELAIVVELEADQTSYTDGAVAADTTYRYRVDAVIDGEVVPYTVEATVATTGVELTSVVWQGRATLASQLTITAVGTPGWHASAEVAYRTWFGPDGEELDEPRTATATVALAEDLAQPGRYLGTFDVADGVAEITTITGVLGDGDGAEARLDATRTPIAVRGAVHVVVDAPEGSIPGGRVVFANLAQTNIDGAATWDVPAMAAGPRTLQVLSARGTVLAEATVEVVAGRHAHVTVTPALPADLTARVLDDEGRAVADALVTFLDADGVVVGAGRSDVAGLAPLALEQVAGEQVEVQVQPPAQRPFLTSTTTVALEPGDNVADVALARRAPGVLTGTVTLGAGVPAVGARVVVSQIDERGGSWSFADVTDDEGRYEITGLAGRGTVTVVYAQDPVLDGGAVELDVEPTVRDYDLTPADRFRFVFSVQTRTADDPVYRDVAIDPVTGGHLQLRLDVQGRPYTVYGASILADAAPGDAVRFCADPSEAGMGPACATATLGDARVVPLTLQLESVGAVRGSVVDAAGRPITNEWVSVIASPVDATQGTHSYQANNGRFDVPVAEPGRYRLTFFRSAPTATSSQIAVTVVDIGRGEIVDVGAVAFVESDWLRDSSVVPTRSTIVAGSTVELRAELRPGVDGAHSGIVARLDVPAGTAVVPGSVVVGGTPVDVSATNGVLEVPVGDRTFGPGSDPVVVRYRLTTAGVAPGASLNPTVHVRATRAGTERTQLAATTVVRVAGVTLRAPATSATHTVQLSGSSPAGTRVRVLDGSAVVGDAVASPGGLWRLGAELADLGSGFEHALVATVEVDDELLTSETVSVVVDERLPVLEQVTMSQPGGRFVTWDPRDGVARFPYVFRSEPVELEARFGGRGTASGVRAVVGAASGPATSLGDGTFHATVLPTHFQLGAVSIDYDTVPDMATVEDVPVLTEAQVRSVLPPIYANAGNPVVVEDHDPSTNTRRAYLTVDTDGGTMTTTLSFTHGLTYTPTASDLAAATRAGVPMYGMSYSITRQGDTVTVEGSGYVPADILGEPEEQGIAAASVAPIGGVVRAGFKTAFEYGTTADGVLTVYGATDKYGQLANIAEWVNSNCSGDDNRFLHELLRLEMERAIAADVLKSSIMLAGAVVGPATFGIGTVGVWAAGFLLDKLVDDSINTSIASVAQLAQETCRDESDESDWWRFPDPPPSPDADPVWIHDPSGYVFEAVESNRVEGVTASLLYSETPDGPFTVWDADWYGQTNPLVTDAEGRYGWDVPEGFWQVAFTAPGYEPARSDLLEVLPPHFDVNVGMRSLASPEVVSVRAVNGTRPAVTLRFSRYMRLDASDHITVMDADGKVVDGIVAAADSETGPDGTFARTFDFLTSSLAAGQVLTVTVDELATSYTDRPMAAPFTAQVTVATVDETAPTTLASVTPEPGPSGWHTGPASVVLTADDGDGSGVAALRWTLEGAHAGSDTVDSSTASIQVTVGGETTVRFSAVDAEGNESPEQTVMVRIDGSAPTAAASVSPPPGPGDWHAGPVSVALTADDGSGSGVAELRWTLSGAQSASGSSATVPVTAPGVTTMRFSAVDVAGNVGVEQSLDVRIDGDRPTVAITSPANGARLHRGDAATVGYACSDDLSGIASCTGSVADGSALPTSTTGLHTVSVTAIDAAGNQATASVIYEVVDDPDPNAMIDELVAKVRSYRLHRAREAMLLVPLNTARLALQWGQPRLACGSLVVFDSIVDLYKAIRWLTPPQATELHAGAVGIRSVLAC